MDNVDSYNFKTTMEEAEFRLKLKRRIQNMGLKMDSEFKNKITTDELDELYALVKRIKK